ncbi:hypothetical protein E2562_007171 [Oryza meyeriana var. granulata]|uniref:J domain-containing protein n=1 Tax=Oryza meyeriana var. granulata TaxID=110450 RepID=A0A6G1CDU9_9ORYZ|nr:hypothetical protein E2562_007171 [Oryza meyeriana var. granulata]
MICAPLGVVFSPRAPAVGYRARKIRCAVAAAPAGIGGGAGGSTLYDVLGLRAGATVREIKAAYRRLARERHPDVAGAPPAAADDFIRLHDAYATLSDPDSRARYDRDVVVVAAMACGGGGAHYRPTTPPAAAPRWYGGASSRRPRRTWETDQCW